MKSERRMKKKTKMMVMVRMRMTKKAEMREMNTTTADCCLAQTT
jgi:hypothetical protein